MTAEHLQDLVGRIYGSSVQQSVDMGRPETVELLILLLAFNCIDWIVLGLGIAKSITS